MPLAMSLNRCENNLNLGVLVRISDNKNKINYLNATAKRFKIIISFNSGFLRLS